MKKKARFMSLAIALAAASTLGIVVPAFAQKHQPKVALAEARVKALTLAPGTVVAEELEHEKGRWIYSFEIKPTGEQGKLVKEVNIDADTGTVVSVETEHG